MHTVTTIGLDIAKSVFQIHGIDVGGQVVIRRQLKRRYVLVYFQKLAPCLVGIEACASSHHWSRELQALGHTVRLMPPAYVKPYVKRHKNDATDAEAICEAVTRPNMRFVATKTPEQQSCLTLHRTRRCRSRGTEIKNYAPDRHELICTWSRFRQAIQPTTIDSVATTSGATPCPYSPWRVTVASAANITVQPSVEPHSRVCARASRTAVVSSSNPVTIWNQCGYPHRRYSS